MLLSTRFSLSELAPSQPAREYKRSLLLDGSPTKRLVYGDSISAQYACGSVYLVVTHYDHYDAVSHWFYVLGATARVLDQASTPDYFGYLQHITIEGSNEIAFGFYGTNDRWHAIVREAGVWSFAWPNLQLRMNRFLLSKRHVLLTCHQGAPLAKA